MINYDLIDLFKKNSINKQLNIVTDDKTTNITNAELHQEQFELTESLCSENELTFGCCEASCIKFTVSNIFLPMKSKWITVKTVLDNNTSKPFLWGRYKVFSDTPTADRTCRDIVAYDVLYDIINADVVNWYNKILPNKDSTTTMKSFRDSFFKHFNVAQADIELVNDNMKIEKTIEPEELSGATVINCICEINGCFGHIGRDGKFHYIYLEQEIQGLYPRNDLYPSNTLYPKDPKSTQIGKSMYITAEYEDYLVKSIDKLQIRQEEDDIGVIVGTGTNTYIIQDNFLVYGKGSEELKGIASNVYKKITKIIYRPFSADCKGNPCLEVGDAIRLPTKYELIESYILKRTISGIQALRDDIESTGDEYRSTDVNSVHKNIIQLKGKTNILTRNIEETKSEIKDTEAKLSSTIEQTASKIRSEVNDVEQGLSSTIEQTANEIKQTVTQKNEYWNTDGYDRNIDYSNYGTPWELGYIDNNTYKNKSYLDFNTGYIYYFSNDWSKVYECQKTTEILKSQITQTAEKILSKVDGIYETKENAQQTERDLSSCISQTAGEINETLTESIKKTKEYAAGVASDAETSAKKDTADKLKKYSTTTEMKTEISKTAEGIRQTVAKTSGYWSTEGYGRNIDYYNYGTPWELGYTGASTYKNKTLLNLNNGYIYHFENDWYKEYECKKTTESLESKIEQTAESITTSVNKTLKNYSTTETMNSAIKQSADNITTSVNKTLKEDYSTTETMNSAIKQSAEGINAEVSKKVNSTEIISSINQSAEEVAISADKINLNGTVTANGNTKINTNGTIEAINANITGTGSFGAGRIGPWNISSDGLFYAVGENTQAYLQYDTIILSQADSAIRIYPYMYRVVKKNSAGGEDGDGARGMEINANTGTFRFWGDWNLPWQ